MKRPPLLESQVSSAYLDADGSLHLYDKDEACLEGWPVGWPERIGCCATFLKHRGIRLANPPARMSLAEQAALMVKSTKQEVERDRLRIPMEDVRPLVDALLEIEASSISTKSRSDAGLAVNTFLVKHPPEL